jgi:hypothetical protein
MHQLNTGTGPPLQEEWSVCHRTNDKIATVEHEGMGLFYTNITVKGPTQGELLEYLSIEQRRAYVSPTVGSVTVVYDCESEKSDSELRRLGSSIAFFFQCPALCALLHDGGLFCYWLYEIDKLLDEYSSNRAYFTGGPSPTPIGGDAGVLCKAFGATERVGDIEILLRKPGYSADQSKRGNWIGAEDRHHDLVGILHLPSFAAGVGYYTILQEGVPTTVGQTRIARTPTAVIPSDIAGPRQMQLFQEPELYTP